MGEQKIIQITNTYSETSLGNYSRWINIATYNIAKMYILGKSDDSTAGGKVEKVYPRRIPFTSNWWFSNRLPSISYSNFKTTLTRMRKDEKNIIHSLNPTVPVVSKTIDLVTFHDIIGLKTSENYNRAFNKLLRSNFKKYFKVMNGIVTTNYVKKDLENYGYNGNIHVIAYPVDKVFQKIDEKETLRKKLNLPLDKKIILSVSSSEPRKNLSIIKKLMDAMSEDFILIRVGSGIDANRVYEKVSRSELNLLYNSADVLLSTSLEEGFGLPTIEAMSCGLPVVLSDREFFREVAGNAAVFIDPLDVLSIKMGINDALSNSKEFTKKGKEQSMRYSFENFSKSMEKLYAELLVLN